MSLTLIIDGIDRTSFLLHESLTITQSNDGLNSTCEFDLIDTSIVQANTWTVGVTRIEDGDVITNYTVFNPSTKVEVNITDGATTYFAGVLSSISTENQGLLTVGEWTEPDTKILHCSCHDFNQMLEESVVDELREYGASTDEEIIDDIFADFVTGIDFATHVSGGYVFAEISFENVTVRQVLDTLCAQSKCVWYVDYSKKLHYATAEVNSPAWHLSDNPDGVNSFPYLDDISKQVDAVNLVNRVFVVGGTTALWFQDTDSIATYGTHQAIVRDTSLVDIDDIEDRGEATLEQFKDPTVTYNLRTYQDGLRAGMHIRIVCAFLDVDDTFLINNLVITFPVDGEPVYEITCGGLESSISVSAHRLTLDQVHNAALPFLSSQAPLASQGWSHNLEFSATDDDTVAWTAGTITTAGGHSLSVAAGNTDNPGAMTDVSYVYLDTDVSLTDLQITTVATAAVGGNRILIAVCAPDPDLVMAMYQVFGGGAGTILLLHADNIAANCLTANEIAVNTITAREIAVGTITATEITGTALSAIYADMGVLTAGEIRMYSGTWDSDANGFRLVTSEIAGQQGGADQIRIAAADGKLYAGAGAVWLDEDGINLSAVDTDPSKIKWIKSATGATLSEIGTYETGTTQYMRLRVNEPSSASVRGVIQLLASAPAGAYSDTDITLYSEDNGATSQISMYAGGSNKFEVRAYKVAVINEVPFQITGGTSDPTTSVADGMLYYRTDTDKLRLRANGAWVDLN